MNWWLIAALVVDLMWLGALIGAMTMRGEAF